jgi:hypothetical protein
MIIIIIIIIVHFLVECFVFHSLMFSYVLLQLVIVFTARCCVGQLLRRIAISLPVIAARAVVRHLLCLVASSWLFRAADILTHFLHRGWSDFRSLGVSAVSEA